MSRILFVVTVGVLAGLVRLFRLSSAAWLTLLPIACAFGQETLTGDVWAHDPSTIIKDGSRYYVFTTGSGIPNKYSTDLHAWTAGSLVFPSGPPAWVTNAVSGYDPNNWAWAPDVAYFNGTYHLYYSVSQWGTIDSVIGLVTSPSLVSPSWTDQGKVVQSDAASEAGPNTDTTINNCIDPSILQDTNGTIWMVYGSYSDGILVTQLDPSTGKRLNPASPGVKIADNGPVFFSNTTEGACLHQRGGYYYLCLNFGGCCAGVDSTYNIRVGRSTSVTGPYLDRNGANLLSGGGTLFLGTYRHYIGPGHAGIFSEGGTDWLSYHYYDGNAGGAAKLGLRRLEWTDDAWPFVSKPGSAASAFYTFEVDARDHLGLRNGQLVNGAAVTSEANWGGVLNLDGTNDYVSLPNGVANGNTFAAWARWNGGATWQRLFDFGDGTSRYLFLTPRANNGKLRFAITFTSSGGEERIDAPTALPTNSWSHVAVTIEPGRGVLYLNGEPVGTNNNMTLLPSQILAHSNFIGKSQWPDPYFSGKIDSFRVFDRTLSSDEVRDLAHARPALAHRFSFMKDATDSIGEADGELKGNAVVTNGMLNLTGQAGDYVDLPGGLVSGCSTVSLEFWATFGANGNWARVFDFGRAAGSSGADYLFYSPHTLGGGNRLELSTGGGTATSDGPGTIDGRTVHVVCLVDPGGAQMSIYTNGVLDRVRVGSVPALSGVSSQAGYLGRSLFSGDAWLNATIDEFRIYDGRLTPAEIAANDVAGPDVLAFTTVPANLAATAGDTEIRLNWTASSIATSYHVKRSFVSGGPYTVITTTLATTYTDTGLANGTTYHYVVSGLNANGESPNSAQASASPAFATPPNIAERIYALTTDNQLMSFNSTDPGTILTAYTVSGLAANEKIVGIDFWNGTLYGLGDQNHLYTLNVANGAAGLVGSFTPVMNGEAFGFEAEPGGLRLVSNLDQDLLLSYSTAAATVGPTINGSPNPAITGLAYHPGNAQVYVADYYQNTIGLLNTGSGLVSPIGLAGIDFSRHNGFDISSNPGDTAYLASPAASSGLAANLYTVDLTTGSATLVGLIGLVGDNTLIRGLAVKAGYVNLNPTNLLVSVNGSQMTLSWPEDRTGWQLQVQTNALSTGLGTNWVDVPGSTSTNSTNITIDASQPAVFYRLRY